MERPIKGLKLERPNMTVYRGGGTQAKVGEDKQRRDRTQPKVEDAEQRLKVGKAKQGRTSNTIKSWRGQTWPKNEDG